MTPLERLHRHRAKLAKKAARQKDAVAKRQVLRADYEARACMGGTVQDLAALAAAGERFAVIYADPPRMAADVPQVVLSPVGAHSAKPAEVRARIERLLVGPYLELYAREQAPGWQAWGMNVHRERNRHDHTRPNLRDRIGVDSAPAITTPAPRTAGPRACRQ